MDYSVRHASGSQSKVKGIVAIAAGAALLLGGGGSLAYWSVSQNAVVDDIQTGDLNLTTGTGTWTLNGVAVADVSTIKIVPGDSLVLTQPLNLTLVGDNLKAQLAVDSSSLVSIGGNTTANVTVTSAVSGLTASGGVYPVTPSTLASNPTIAATVTINFASSTPNRADVNATINLDKLVFTLTQVAA